MAAGDWINPAIRGYIPDHPATAVRIAPAWEKRLAQSAWCLIRFQACHYVGRIAVTVGSRFVQQLLAYES